MIEVVKWTLLGSVMLALVMSVLAVVSGMLVLISGAIKEIKWQPKK